MSYDPYALAFPAAAFPLSSKEFEDGGALPASAYQPANESPELSWGAAAGGHEEPGGERVRR